MGLSAPRPFADPGMDFYKQPTYKDNYHLPGNHGTFKKKG